MLRPVLALLALLAVLTLAARSGRLERARQSGFEATATGATTATLGGSAVAAPRSIELEGRAPDGTLLMQWSFADRPGIGSYAAGDSAGAVTLHALFLAGPDSAPAGVFRGHRGMLHIRHVSPQVITGTFELLALGTMAVSPRNDTLGVRIAGSFIATTVSP